MKSRKFAADSLILILMILSLQQGNSQTIALWLFDEAKGLYPSHVIDDSSPNDFPMVLGLGGSIVDGKFGNALEPKGFGPLQIPEGEVRFGLKEMPIPEGRTQAPLSWHNAHFTALMCSGEKHLRNQIGFKNPTRSDLNLADFDWTVEFWMQINRRSTEKGVVFEIGSGPLGEKSAHTSLALNKYQNGFTFENTSSGKRLQLKTVSQDDLYQWHHFAFVYDAHRGVLTHYVDGKFLFSGRITGLKRIRESEDAYFSVGRSGKWKKALPGKLDELHFYHGLKYPSSFDLPASLAPSISKSDPSVSTRPLLFCNTQDKPLDLADRKHLFIDDAILAVSQGVEFVVNPPKKAEVVMENIEGPFRKHLTVLEDERGIIRLYNSVEKDYLAVHTSKDGIHFTEPDLGAQHVGRSNIVIPQVNGGMGTPFIDPNGLDDMRYKYLSDNNRRGVYLYTSPDGYQWKKHSTAILPFRSGSQSCTFYDDQRAEYIAYHRTDMQATPNGATLRGSVLTLMNDITVPLAYQKLSQHDYYSARDSLILRNPQPWFMDNGPLTPGGFALEFPLSFRPEPEDPIGTDIYVTKAQKYPWAPDTYFAFPIVYFHYEADGPDTRKTLMDQERGLGSGPLETQLAVSRDGIHWQRKYRPAYVGIGPHAGHQVVTAYLAHGMVRRGDEIWQYYFGEDYYHSPWNSSPEKRGVYRLVQRLDGFVSMDSPYDREVEVMSKLLTFQGSKLYLNLDTDAVGYVQIGFVDENNIPIQGLSVDDCVYINGDFIDTEVEWLSQASVSQLEGKSVKIVFRMRGSKLYALQFRD